MGIKGIPATHQEFAAVGDQYEAEHFGFDDGGPFAAALFIAISAVDATLALVALGARLLPRP